MVVRVAERVAATAGIDDVWVATDDTRIADVVERAGHRSVLTDPSCASGTDRVARAVASLPDASPAVVINVQGDEPLIDPQDLGRLVDACHRRPTAIATLARPATPADDLNDPNLVKIALTGDLRALYFSRASIPYGAAGAIHVGVYGYAPATLARFCAAAPSALERAERLEQLRALELGIPIYATMCEAMGPSIGVDVPSDIARVEAVLRASRPEQGTS